ncbi:MAG: glutamyl-tRNA reductase [Candidatus Kapaibacteriota bacterium]
MAENQKISVVGLNIKTATIEELEHLQIPRKEFNNLLTLFASQIGVEGVVFLSTCNRSEIYFSHCEDIKPFELVKNFYKEFFHKDIDKRKNLFYQYHNREAVRHLFRVVSGLDSMVIGEYQIVGQVKEAYSIACQVKTVDKVLHKLFHAAFRCSKVVRNSTSIGKGKFSVSGVATDIVLKSIEPDTNIAIVGVNENTMILSQELKKVGFSNFFFINRTLHKAQHLAEKFGGSAFSLAMLDDILCKADIVFTSTSAPSYIIPAKSINESFEATGKPKIILDLAIPRDVDVTGLNTNIQYFDIEKLKQYLKGQQKAKLEEIQICEKIIDNEVAVFLSWHESANDELFEPFAEKFERIRKELLDEYSHLLHLDDMALMDKVTRQLLHRVKSVFVSILKESK